MSTINTGNYPGFIGQANQSKPRFIRTAAPHTGDLENSSISSTTVFGFLMALTSAALLLLTDQPPWVLLPAVAALFMALLLSKVSKEGLQA